MKLLRLKLENFRQHVFTDVEFRDGMTAIVGANGAGKSTILEGITYALYAKQRENKDTIRNYWTDKKNFLARLEFEFDGRRFEVQRTMNDAHLKLLEGGAEKVWSTSASETTRACIKLLGLTYDQFVNSFCAVQKELAFLDFKSSTARHDEVARMLGFDRLRLAGDLAAFRRKEHGDRSKGLEDALGNLEVLTSEAKQAAAAVSDSERTLAGLSLEEVRLKTLAEPAKQRSKLAERWNVLTGDMLVIRGQAEILKSNLQAAELNLVKAKAEAEELSVLIEVEKQFLALESRVNELSVLQNKEMVRRQKLVARNELATEVISIEAEIAALKVPDLAKLQKRVADSEAALVSLIACEQKLMTAWQAEIGLANEQKAKAESQAERAARDLAQAREMVAKGMCPECGQRIGDGYVEILQRRESAATAADARLVECRCKVATLSKRPASLDEIIRDRAAGQSSVQLAQAAQTAAEKLFERSRMLEADILKKRARINELDCDPFILPTGFDEATFASVVRQCEELKPSHKRFLALGNADQRLLSAQAQHVAAKLEHDSARDRFRELDAERKQLPFETADEVPIAIDAYKTLDRQVFSVIESIRHETKLKVERESRVLQAQKRLSEHRENEKRLAEHRRNESLYDETARQMRKLRSDLNAAIGPELEARSSENLALLTNGRYSQLKLDGNFRPTVIDDGARKEVISGGEEDVVALALRLALSELIQERQGRPLSLLILDEVFGSLDAERRLSVLDRLAGIKGRFEQILVISHIEEINQVADQCLYVTRDAETRGARVTDSPQELIVDLF